MSAGLNSEKQRAIHKYEICTKYKTQKYDIGIRVQRLWLCVDVHAVYGMKDSRDLLVPRSLRVWKSLRLLGLKSKDSVIVTSIR